MNEYQNESIKSYSSSHSSHFITHNLLTTNRPIQTKIRFGILMQGRNVLQFANVRCWSYRSWKGAQDWFYHLRYWMLITRSIVGSQNGRNQRRHGRRSSNIIIVILVFGRRSRRHG